MYIETENCYEIVYFNLWDKREQKTKFVPGDLSADCQGRATYVISVTLIVIKQVHYRQQSSLLLQWNPRMLFVLLARHSIQCVNGSNEKMLRPRHRWRLMTYEVLEGLSLFVRERFQPLLHVTVPGGRLKNEGRGGQTRNGGAMVTVTAVFGQFLSILK